MVRLGLEVAMSFPTALWLRFRCSHLCLPIFVAGIPLLGLGCSGAGGAGLPAAGELEISVVTNGPSPDPDGYTVTLDGADRGTIAVSDVLTLTAIDPGAHQVGLSGLAANCTVGEENPRGVSIVAGELAAVSFAVTCVAPPPTSGILQVTSTTTGTDLDADGYLVGLGQQTPVAIAVTGSHTFEQVAPGPYQVTLTGLASNCRLEGSNPGEVAVTAGATATVAFTVTCSTPPGISWTPMISGIQTDLLEVAGSSATNVFAAGTFGTILHYDGVSWSTELVPEAGPFLSMWVNASDAFALGYGHYFHDDGQAWGRMPPPPCSVCLVDPEFPDEFQADTRALWGSSATDVFAVGHWGELEYTFGPYIAHYDGAVWSEIKDLPDMMGLPPGCLRLNDVWGTSPQDIYAVGYYESQGGRDNSCYHGDEEIPPATYYGIVLHYDGRTWSEVLRQPDLRFRHVWANSPGDIYVGGATSTGPSRGSLWRFDGSRWSALTLPPNAPRVGPVWGSSASDILIIADDKSVWHFDGATWRKTYESTTELWSIWGSSASDIFVVGNNGTILHGTR